MVNLRPGSAILLVAVLLCVGGFSFGCANHNERSRAYVVPFSNGEWTQALEKANLAAKNGPERSLIIDHLDGR